MSNNLSSMRVEMTLRDLEMEAPFLYGPDELEDQRVAIHLRSGPGIGKSQCVGTTFKQALEEHFNEEFGFIQTFPTTLESPDVRGFPIPHKRKVTDEDGRERQEAVTIFTLSPIIRQVRDTGMRRGILFIDERDQADMMVQKALAPLVLDRNIEGEALPPGWMVISASNEKKHRSGTIAPPAHLTNRERSIFIKGDVDTWASWAAAYGVHPLMIAFARDRAGLVFSGDVPADTTQAYCTPRSFVAANDYMMSKIGFDYDAPLPVNDPNRGRGGNDPDRITKAIVAGSIGAGVANELFGWLMVQDVLPDIRDVIKRPDTVELPPVQRMDAHYALSQMLVHYADDDNIEPLWTCAERMRKELQVSIAQQLIDKTGGTLMNSKKFSSWMSQNRAKIISTAR